MRTATDPSRRAWLASAAGALLCGPAGAAALLPQAATGAGLRLAATWATAGQHHVGVLGCLPTSTAEPSLAVMSAFEVPTRAHGLCRGPDGAVFTVARRPGDWLVRWHPDGGRSTWCWIEPDRAFTGHVLVSDDGARVFTAETDLDTGAGLIGVREGRSLRKLGEWATGGTDPHELLWVPDTAGQRLVVANGGVQTRPETGRAKIDLDRMDSSLVCLEAHQGQTVGAWRLPDARLSIRHLAWSRPARGQPRVLGVALQAEHDDPVRKAAAPVLALWDGQGLRTAEPGGAMAGYGGDIAAGPLGFAVSSPKGGRVGWWAADGRWLGATPLSQACALAAADDDDTLWGGGEPSAAALAAPGVPAALHPVPLRLDNHWLVLRSR